MIVCGWSFFAQSFLKQRKICFFASVCHIFMLRLSYWEIKRMMEIAPRKYFTDNILPCNARMYAAALAITGSPEDAADAVQTATLRIWENICKGIFPEVPAAYCLSAIRNICLTESARASRKIPLDTTREIPTGDDGTEKAIELNEVTATLRRLPEKERKAVEMSAFAGCSADDIAEVLGISAANARQILSRGRRRLRSFFH